MRVLLLILLLHPVVARPHRSDEAEEDSPMNENDYEGDNTNREREMDNVSSNGQQAEERPYRLVDYSGNSFPQRAPSRSAAAAAAPPPAAASPDDAATLSEDQTLDYEGDTNANLNEKYNIRNSKQNPDHLRASVDTFSEDTDDQERESYEQPALTAQNNAHNCKHILHNRAGNLADRHSESRADKTKGKYMRYVSKQSVYRNNPEMEYSPQRMYESVLMSRQRGNRDNAITNHNVRSTGIGNENEKSNVAEYKNSVPDPISAVKADQGALDTELIVKQNDDSFGLENHQSAEYDVKRAAYIDGNRERRNANDVDNSKLTNEVADALKPAQPVQGTNVGASIQNDDSADAKEQLAIKRHIANLTRNQLDELLASISADKRELLQEIIGNDRAEVIKRDVSKNNEVMQATNDKENKLDTSGKVNIQQVSLDKESAATQEQESAMVVQNKPENEAIYTKETIEIANKKDSEESGNSGDQQSAMSSSSNERALKMNDRSKLKSEEGLDQTVGRDDTSKVSETKKADSDKTNVKRQINKNNYDSEDSAEFPDIKGSEESFVIPNDDEVSHSNDKSEVNHDVQLSKRDTSNKKFQKQEQSIYEQLQALEDSFPSVRSYDETNYQGFKMSPLVRVKRNKRESSKRSAAVLPDGKQSHPSYRADTEDEDDDEGNEFEDDGFFDRTSNLNRANVKSCPSLKGSSNQEKSSNDANNDPGENLTKLLDDETEAAETDVTNEVSKKETAKTETKYAKDLPKISENKHESGNTINQDLSNMGSDTDNVLSGSEGADENLMLTSAARSRLSRDSDKDVNSLGEGRETEDVKKAGEDLQSVQNDPNGAFGGLPKNYDGELSRYKRIRRTKQLASAT